MNPGGARAARRREAIPHEPAPHTLLVVDDDDDNRKLVATFFTRHGYGVREASDGDEGLELARAPDVDVVLLDQLMPGKTGLEILKILRAEGNLVPIVLLTADSHVDFAVAVMAAGADDHVTKPCSLPVLRARVERRLAFVIDDDPEIVEEDDPHGAQIAVHAPPRSTAASAAASTDASTDVAAAVSAAATTDASSSSSSSSSSPSWLGRLKDLAHKVLHAEPRPELSSGVLLGGRYRLDAPVGIGKTGTVWRARHIELDVDVAVKVLHKDTPSLQTGESARDSLRREALLLARCGHPNVVRALDASRGDAGGDGHAWLVMELLSGEAVRVKLQRDGGVLPVKVACGICADVASALACCHRHGVVHRDVKALNVFLAVEDSDDAPITKLCDFGAACAVDDVSQHDLLIGTPSHMAPERFDSPRATPESDVYAVGVLLHHLLTGALPFVADDVEGLARLHQTQKPTPPSSLVKDLPAGVDDAVARLLRKIPAERPTAKEAAALLRNIARSQQEKEKRARGR